MHLSKECNRLRCYADCAHTGICQVSPGPLPRSACWPGYEAMFEQLYPLSSPIHSLRLSIQEGTAKLVVDLQSFQFPFNHSTQIEFRRYKRQLKSAQLPVGTYHLSTAHESELWSSSFPHPFLCCELFQIQCIHRLIIGMLC